MKDHSIVSKAFSKSRNKSNPAIFFSQFGLANDTNDKSTAFSSKSTFYKTSLIVIDEIRKKRFQAIRIDFAAIL